MRRTGFKNKTYAEILEKKKSKPKVKLVKKTPKKSQIKRLKGILWELCKQITRLKHGNTCYTCGKVGLAGSSWHTGHFIPSSVGGHSIRYSLDNLRPQCYKCNIDLSGNGSQFYRNLLKDYGQEYIDNLFEQKHKIIKADEIWYQSKIDEYRLLLQDLQKELQDNLLR